MTSPPGLNPLLRYGHKNTLDLEHLYKLQPELEVAQFADQFEQLWRDQAAKYEAGVKEGVLNPVKPSVKTIIIKILGPKYFMIGIIKFISDTGFCSAPLIMKGLITYIQTFSTQGSSASLGYAYAIGIFLVSMIASVTFGFFFQRCNKYGMIVRGALTAVAYRKSLRLSGAARQEFNAGRITNIISTDLVRLDLFLVFFHLAWSYIVQTVYVVSFLLWVLGPASLAGVAMLLFTIPLQIYVIRWLVKLRKQNAMTTDQRIRTISETLSSIRIIKFFSWENSFLARVSEIRTKELEAVVNANLIRSVITASGFALPVLAAGISFAVYFLISPVFDGVVIFTSLALFNNLRNPIQWSPIILGSYADAKVAVERIQALLESSELTFEPEYRQITEEEQNAIVVEHGDFVWETSESNDASPLVEDGTEAPLLSSSEGNIQVKETVPDMAQPSSLSNGYDDSAIPIFRKTLSDVEFSIPKGSLVAIVGAVGSGKSSLLSALVGQLKPCTPSAKVIFSGSVGYAPQQPWIMNTSLKENILFGLPFNEKKYNTAIDACALRKDLQVLSGGDSAEIGEKGINLSGGQKARVSIARLCFFDADIVLLDDPLSAVDANVGKHIFEECIQGVLSKKTRLLVTHQLHFVPQCDYILTMKEGRIAEFGTFNELMRRNGDFADLMNSYGGIPTTSELDLAAQTKAVAQTGAGHSSSTEVNPTPISTNTVPLSSSKGMLIKAEEKSEGGIKSSIFISFAIAMGGRWFLLLMLFVLILAQVGKVANDMWLVFWTNQSISTLTPNQYLYIYMGLGLSQALFLVLFSILVAVGAIKAARLLHEKALTRVLHAPISFFDTNPLGRILNRFSRDCDIIDNTLPDAIRLFLITFGSAISTFALVTYVTSGWFLLLLVPLMAIYYYFQSLYRANARELKRLDALTRSPLYAHVSESMTGVSTIRAYREQSRFIRRTDSLIDMNNTPYYIQTTAARWLGIRLEIIGNCLILFTALFGVITRDTANPALIGLALSYVLQVTQLLSLCIRQFTDAEVQLVSIERLNYYAKHIQVESSVLVDDERNSPPPPPPDWPMEGRITFESLSMRYQPDLPLVLKSINLEIGKHEKVGVVGRTGSGKSSLMLSLFRILEPDSGKITIDGIDISTLGVKDLRSRLSIIPQDPVLFSGTVRSNLDPLSEHSDLDIWNALESAGMKTAVGAMDGGLNATVDSLGENLSVGQRQLLCLARAILRRPKLIVLDECTANVDLETDHFIQLALKETMHNATILTIAHRLNTVMEADRILVLDNGHVVEFDSPRKLLLKGGGVFASMVKETGSANSKALKAMVGL
ncbi:P-loop containing nucleoside triphosphate hydrolase protein [Obelidium mucronatum]|nr:P-loop containing nucleoside triphosphate hydrolase protein [Obelidium mucronatum]